VTSAGLTATDSTFADFMIRCHEALAQQTQGHSAPFLELWSHTEEATVMAAVGGYHVGFENVSKLLSDVSKTLDFDTWGVETIATQVAGDFAYTVEVERMTRRVEGKVEEMAVRATQVYRRSDDGWRVLHRHGDLLGPVAVKW
jgi:ketosteroid isomerase-like protein